MIEVDLPDGNVAEFPDGTPNEVIKGALQKRFGSPKPQQPSMVAKALEPITSLPETYNAMRNDSAQQMATGAGQVSNAMSGEDAMGSPVENRAWEAARGVGNAAAGGLGFVTSPINAALRTVVGKPIEENTGVPKEVSEFAASMVLPIPKAMPRWAAPAAKVEQAAVPSTAQLYASAKEGYQAADKTGVAFKPEAMGKLADDIASNLKSANSRDYLAPQTHRAIQELRLEDGASLADVRATRQLFGEIAQGGDKFERRAASLAIKDIDGFLAQSAPETARILKDANANYAAASRAKQIDTAAEVAGLRTGRAGYGGNAVNSMRQVLSPIVEKAIKGKRGGFSNEEIAAMREIVEGSTATNSMRIAGMADPSRGSIQAIGGIAAGAVSGGMGFAIPAIGLVSNRLATSMTAKQIERLDEMVRKRSPAYAEAVAKSSEKYFKAADAFSEAPSPSNFAATLVAARALSSGLVRDGVQVSSADLLRLVQGPMKTAADNEQPEPERGVNQ